VWEALRYVSKTPSLLATLTMVLIVGTFTYEYSVSLPALARLTFNGSAATLALLTSSFGLGAVVGGLINARGGKPDPTALPSRIVLLAAASLLLALCSNLILAVAAVMLLGFSSIRFSAFANSALQLTSAPAMRGRVLAFFSSAWVGSTAIGGPLVGWIAQHAGGRWAVAFGGVTALAAAAIGLAILQITDRKTA
jgi:MFS family permease